MELNNAMNNAKKNRDPKDALKVKMTEKSARDIMEYLSALEDLQKKFRDIR